MKMVMDSDSRGDLQRITNFRLKIQQCITLKRDLLMLVMVDMDMAMVMD